VPLTAGGERGVSVTNVGVGGGGRVIVGVGVCGREVGVGRGRVEVRVGAKRLSVGAGEGATVGEIKLHASKMSPAPPAINPLRNNFPFFIGHL